MADKVMLLIIRPLQSRKTRIALSAFIAWALLEYFGIQISETKLLTGISLVVALIVSIAIEDHGAKSGATVNIDPTILSAEQTPAGGPTKHE